MWQVPISGPDWHGKKQGSHKDQRLVFESFIYRLRVIINKMKKLRFIIVGIIVVVVAGLMIYTSPKTRFDPETNQPCEVRGRYCYYTDIPSGMLYTQPDEDIPKNLRLSSEDMEILERIGSDVKEIHEIFGMDPSKYRCKNTGENPVIIMYFYDTCEWAAGMYGCGYERGAIVCGDVYFIEQYHDTTGPVMFGPFNL